MPTKTLTHMQFEKIDMKTQNAIAYFAEAHRKKSRKPLHSQALYKYLSFLDFETLRETGAPSLNLRYKAMKMGPVPIDIYDQREILKSDLFEFKSQGGGTFAVIAKKSPDMDFFSTYEKEKMENLIEIFAHASVYTEHFSDASHEKIRAWRETWRNRPNTLIDYALEFEENPRKKRLDELTSSEENFLIREALKKAIT